MAILIPEHLPDTATGVERKVFAALQTLPDDVWVYYEPVVRRRYPDFIVIVPSLGVIVIEVKGYPLPWVKDVGWHEIVYMQAAREQRQAHPSRQAREYMNRFMSECDEHPDGADLKANGRLSFAVCHLSLMMGMKRDDLRQSPWAQFFPSDTVLCRDEFDQEFSNADAIISCMRRAINPDIPIKPLTGRKIEVIRTVLHDIGTIPSKNTKKPSDARNESPLPSGSDNRSVASIDRDQEAFARSVGGGHRIIYGVPGSGKTIILLYRAKMMAEAGRSVLFVCYNVPFSRYVEAELADYPNVNVQTFGQWARTQGAPVNFNDSEAYGQGLLDRIRVGGGEAGTYDCVLVDEGQDFFQSWFRSVVFALKEPANGDLMIAYDWSQNLYRSDLPVWSQLGINAVGRTKRLKENYRNTKQIVSAAHTFSVPETDYDDDRPHSVPLHMDNCRRLGPWPTFQRQSSLDAQIAWARDTVRKLLDGSFEASTGPFRADPDEIKVLCRNNNLLQRIEAAFSGSGLQVTVSTIHGSKGLQARVVILVGAEQLSAPEDRALLYVGLTRPEDLLIASWSHDTPLTKEMEQNVESYRADLGSR